MVMLSSIMETTTTTKNNYTCFLIQGFLLLDKLE